LPHDLGAKILIVIVGKRHPVIAPSGERVWKKFAKEGGLRCMEEVEKNKVILGLEKGLWLLIDRTELMLWS
jgi:hypothetical protein